MCGGGTVGIFLERLLLELTAILLQLAVFGIVRWLRNRSAAPGVGLSPV
jgi:uncharacterized membrane protein